MFSWWNFQLSYQRNPVSSQKLDVLDDMVREYGVIMVDRYTILDGKGLVDNKNLGYTKG